MDELQTKVDKKKFRARMQLVTDRQIQEVCERSEEHKRRFVGVGPLGKFAEELLLALGIVKDYWTGAYRKIPYWALGGIVFMFLYLGNPVDLVPDFLIGLGQLDDLLVVTVCLLLVRQELHEYKRWKDGSGPADDTLPQ